MGSSCAEATFTQYRRKKIRSKQIKTVPVIWNWPNDLVQKGIQYFWVFVLAVQNISLSRTLAFFCVLNIKIEILHEMLLVKGLRIPFSLDVDVEDDANDPRLRTRILMLRVFQTSR